MCGVGARELPLTSAEPRRTRRSLPPTALPTTSRVCCLRKCVASRIASNGRPAIPDPLFFPDEAGGQSRTIALHNSHSPSGRVETDMEPGEGGRNHRIACRRRWCGCQKSGVTAACVKRHGMESTFGRSGLHRETAPSGTRDILFDDAVGSFTSRTAPAPHPLFLPCAGRNTTEMAVWGIGRQAAHLSRSRLNRSIS